MSDPYSMVMTLTDPETDAETVIETWQAMIDGNLIWGISQDMTVRTLGLIKDGTLILGPIRYATVLMNDEGEIERVEIPSRYDLVPGDVGTVEYAEQKRAEIQAELDRWSFEV